MDVLRGRGGDVLWGVHGGKRQKKIVLDLVCDGRGLGFTIEPLPLVLQQSPTNS